MAAVREGGYPRTGALVGLLLGIWPLLVPQPSIPTDAPTLQAVDPTLVWNALASLASFPQGLGGGPLRGNMAFLEYGLKVLAVQAKVLEPASGMTSQHGKGEKEPAPVSLAQRTRCAGAGWTVPETRPRLWPGGNLSTQRRLPL